MNMLIVILILLIIGCFILLLFQEPKIQQLLFSEKCTHYSEYVCPCCGSNDWKFPNPLKPSEGMLNLLQFANMYKECKRCEYVGIFFATGKGERFSFMKKNEPIMIERNQRILLIGAMVFAFYLMLFHTIVGAAAGFYMVRHINNYYKKS